MLAEQDHDAAIVLPPGFVDQVPLQSLGILVVDRSQQVELHGKRRLQRRRQCTGEEAGM